MFTPRCDSSAREFPRSVNFSLRHTVEELRGIKLPNFRILAYFPYTKPLKRTDDQPTAPIFPRGSRRSKRVPSGTKDFLRLLVGELRAPKLAQIFAYGKWLYPYIMLLHGASDLDQRCPKTRSSEDECTFPPHLRTYPQNHSQNLILGDLSVRNLLYREPSISRTLMELRRWKFTVI